MKTNTFENRFPDRKVGPRQWRTKRVASVVVVVATNPRLPGVPKGLPNTAAAVEVQPLA